MSSLQKPGPFLPLLPETTVIKSLRSHVGTKPELIEHIVLNHGWLCLSFQGERVQYLITSVAGADWNLNEGFSYWYRLMLEAMPKRAEDGLMMLIRHRLLHQDLGPELEAVVSMAWKSILQSMGNEKLLNGVYERLLTRAKETGREEDVVAMINQHFTHDLLKDVGPQASSTHDFGGRRHIQMGAAHLTFDFTLRHHHPPQDVFGHKPGAPGSSNEDDLDVGRTMTDHEE